MPAIPRDLAVLPLAVESVRRYVDHPIGQIIVVGPPDPALRAVCEAAGCRFVDERLASPIPDHHIDYRPFGVDRGPWIHQQLLKLNAQSLVEQEHFLVVDADTALLRARRFVGRDACCLWCADEYHGPYFDAFERLMGFAPPSLVSFVAHHMVFSTRVLAAMKAHIEAHWRRPWAEAILAILDRREWSGFSEYETYANWLLATEPSRVRIQYCRSVALAQGSAAHMRGSIANAAGAYDMASFHYYTDDTAWPLRTARRVWRRLS
jgi:hypothetical protein